MAIATWLAGFGSAFCIKLSSSIDDVVWLAPFLTSNSSVAQRVRNVVIYISVCLVQTCIAIAIAYSGSEFVDWVTEGSDNVWTTEKILTVAAGSLMAVYSVKLTHEWYTDEGDDEEEGEGEGKGEVGETKYDEVATQTPCDTPREAPSADAGEDGEAGKTRTLVREETDKADKKDGQNSQALFVIAFIGSVDDLTLFVPMLVGKGFDIVQLIGGGILAASLIVCFCLFIGLCKPIADCLAKIPLALIVGVFAVGLITKAIFME